jgi:hypothetical protein
MGSKKRSAQRRAAETQQGQTRLESILAAIVRQLEKELY